MSDSDSEKTEEATPERRRKAREEGQFPRAKDAGATVGSVAALVCLAGMGPTMVETLRGLCVRFFGDPVNMMRGDPSATAMAVLSALAVLMLPTTGAAMLAATAIGFAEAGYEPRIELAQPKWERLSPLGKIKQLFSPGQMMMNVALQIARVIVVSLVAYYTLRAEFPRLTRLARAALPGATAEVAASVFRLAVWASLALAVIAIADYAHNWYRHEKQIRMSRQEIKDEMKQHEGDPAMKGRQRARAREMLRRGLLKEVKRSDVVIANPTHISIALRYRSDEGAPVVSAKGVDDVALFIRKIAKEHGVPVIRNVPLARALNERVRAGRTIPVDLYTAVAEVLAFVYRLKSRRGLG